jgi:SpoVK/Ycf46/Vps4 family AAA+-type ATPase
LDLLNAMLVDYNTAPDVSLAHLARQTAAFVAADIRDLIDKAELSALSRTRDFW